MTLERPRRSAKPALSRHSKTVAHVEAAKRPAGPCSCEGASKRDPGNTSAWAASAVAASPAIVQENGPGVSYTGAWRSASSSSASGGSLRYSNAAGSHATFAFTGRQVAWVAAAGPARGRAEVYLDGTYVRTVDLYASTARSRRLLFTTAWASSAAHTLRIRVLGTSGRPRVDVDAFAVLR